MALDVPPENVADADVRQIERILEQSSLSAFSAAMIMYLCIRIFSRPRD
jgi:hypothetical protein